MVSLWPWKGSSSSTASFEKTLSTLSAKITHVQSRLDKTRAGARRAKVLWTLYLSFAYLVYAIVLVLVVGHRNLGLYEWAGIVGGPVLIYLVRTINAAFYNFRIDSFESRLKEHQEERARTIQQLKDATKYDSTLELIEKYGGADRSESAHVKGDVLSGDGPGGNRDANHADAGGKSAQNTPGRGTPSRIMISPPPTANIQRSPGTPVPPFNSGLSPARPSAPSTPLTAGADFAPNAFGPPPPPQLPPAESHWYDRIFDVLLGEDETAPKNRIALICRSCRLVNGQAPPGTRSLADLGVWKCMSCGAANGEPDEGRKIVREVVRDAQQRRRDERSTTPGEDGKDQEQIDAAARESGSETGGAGATATTTGQRDGEAVDVSSSETKSQGPAASVRSRRGKNKK